MCFRDGNVPPKLMVSPDKGSVLSRQQPRKKFPRQEPAPEKSQSRLACLLCTNEFEDGPSEYICADKDAYYLCGDVDNPTLGIFRVSARVALIELLSPLA